MADRHAEPELENLRIRVERQHSRTRKTRHEVRQREERAERQAGDCDAPLQRREQNEREHRVEEHLEIERPPRNEQRRELARALGFG